MSTTNKKITKQKGINSPIEKIILSEQDKALSDIVFEPSKQIDGIAAALVIRDTEYIIEYLRQRINLEQKYFEDLNLLTKNVQTYCKSDENNIIQKSFMNYVGLTDKFKLNKLQYINILKQQSDELLKFRNEQHKTYEKNKHWMNRENNEYINTRLKELPAALNHYNQLCDEIERSSSSPMAPLTHFPTSISRLQHEEFDTNMRSMSIDEDRIRNNLKYGENSPSRLKGFMKRHLNKPEDSQKQNIKVAKLKVEVVDADAKYRDVVREINTKAIKIDATNQYVLNNVQVAFKEKSDKVKHMLQITLQADLDQLKYQEEPTLSLLNSVNQLDCEAHSKVFTNSSTYTISKLSKPSPVYYNNYHVGICKDLIFGTSLTEYAQQKHRSPPLLITKCIEALERLGGLEKEGIYRVSGKQSNLEKIRHAFEIDEEAVVIGQADVPEDVFSIASIIKIFLRELKSPLFPFKLTDRLVYSQIPDAELRLMNLLTRLIKLQPANYDTLKALIHHLTNLQACLDKNKMTINNLTLIFTPAIFQDLNHAQSAPGEWAKDCVLEDLILNYQDIFAHKDLHNNAAITGDIQYGFGNVEVEDPKSRYAMTVQSPESPIDDESNESEYTFFNSEITAVEEAERDGYEEYTNDIYSMYDDEDEVEEEDTSKKFEQLTKAQEKEPVKNHSRTNSEKKRYQAHFQEKGLSVQTGASIATTTKSQPDISHPSPQQLNQPDISHPSPQQLNQPGISHPSPQQLSQPRLMVQPVRSQSIPQPQSPPLQQAKSLQQIEAAYQSPIVQQKQNEILAQSIQSPQTPQNPQQSQITQRSQTPQQLQTPQRSQTPQQLQTQQRSQTPQQLQPPQRPQTPQQLQSSQRPQTPQHLQNTQRPQTPQQPQTAQQPQIVNPPHNLHQPHVAQQAQIVYQSQSSHQPQSAHQPQIVNPSQNLHQPQAVSQLHDTQQMQTRQHLQATQKIAQSPQQLAESPQSLNPPQIPLPQLPQSVQSTTPVLVPQSSYQQQQQQQQQPSPQQYHQKSSPPRPSPQQYYQTSSPQQHHQSPRSDLTRTSPPRPSPPQPSSQYQQYQYQKQSAERSMQQHHYQSSPYQNQFNHYPPQTKPQPEPEPELNYMDYQSRPQPAPAPELEYMEYQQQPSNYQNFPYPQPRSKLPQFLQKSHSPAAKSAGAPSKDWLNYFGGDDDDDDDNDDARVTEAPRVRRSGTTGRKIKPRGQHEPMPPMPPVFNR